MKNIVKVATLLSLSAATLLASGYRIPEQSLNSVAMSAAYVASANGADASYYNPANMVFMGEGAYIEMGMTYINLPKVSFTTAVPGRSGDSLEEQFFMPTMHYVSPMMGDWRYGLSIVAPAGLSKRWDESYAKTFAEEFTLKVIEVNPTASYRVNDQFSLGFGLRGVYTEGVVKSNGVVTVLAGPTYINASRDLTGDSIDFGYNLAMTYKPVKDLILSATYRSKVDLTVEGDAYLTRTGLATPYNGGASVTIPLPASLALAAAYTMDKTTVEFVFERTYWSSYKNLDFSYDTTLADPILYSAFDAPKNKLWKDVNAYRIGISHQYSDALKLMAGFAIDKTPAPDSTLGFELPDSDAKLYSVGFEYKINEKTKVGLAYLYDDKEDRTVSNGTVNGTFTDSSAHLVTASLKYKF
ncbi:MAG: outer membrane protein transport protein [Campylobacteraceae bacterium]|nr:outer membrane protein transport protein [Campylobacteraceae bacterium]